MWTYRVGVIPGDGIGPEVTNEAVKVLTEASKLFGFGLDFAYYPLGAAFYREHGEELPTAIEAELALCDALFLGAVGDPSVPPGILERGLILRLRRVFDQYVNYRPAKLYPGVVSPIARLSPRDCDLVVLRENTEGLYVGSGVYLNAGTPGAVATQSSVTTGRGTERLVRYGFDLAMRRRGRVTLVHKTNILVNAGRLWMDTVEAVQAEYPAVELDYTHVDSACQHLVVTPQRFDVIVTDNLFGDILSDLTATIQGGLGVAASANLNPDRTAPSMFEPVHGSAPDIAGKGCANPAAAILSAAMLLSHIGEEQAARVVEEATGAALGELGAADRTAPAPATAEIGEMIRSRLAATGRARESMTT